jgi:hypothetical protein
MYYYGGAGSFLFYYGGALLLGLGLGICKPVPIKSAVQKRWWAVRKKGGRGLEKRLTPALSCYTGHGLLSRCCL